MAPYILRIINYKTEMDFGYDGKHGAYQPHIIRAPAVPPPPPAATAVGISATAYDSPPAGARSPLAASRHAPSAAPNSSRAASLGLEVEHPCQGPQDTHLYMSLQRCSYS
jgi:hypothetical protein